MTANHKARTLEHEDDPVRILVVDDHPIFRAGVEQVLHDDPDDFEIVAQVADVDEGFEHASKLRPDLALIDINLDESNGLELVRRIRAAHLDEVRVIVVSAHNPDVYADRAFDAGADGYLDKQQVLDALTDAVQTVLRGERFGSPNGSRNGSREEFGVSTLTDRELEVFELIGQGLTTQEVAGRLFISDKTVETHRANLKKKLNVDSAPALVARAASWVAQEM